MFERERRLISEYIEFASDLVGDFSVKTRDHFHPVLKVFVGSHREDT